MRPQHTLRLNTVLYDWFTVTSFEQSFCKYWREEIGQLNGAGEYTDARKLKRYLGQARQHGTGTVFLGEMTQPLGLHFAVVLEGEAADLMRRQVRFSLENHNARLTRVDIQATILKPEEWSQVRLYNRVDRLGRGGDILHDDDKKFGRLYTVYIGSKKSDRFMRVYDKPTDDGVCLRAEMQLSHQQAEMYGRRWLSGRISESAAFAGALEWSGDKKLDETFRSIVEGWKGLLPPYVRKETDTDKWLVDDVLPVLARRLFAHDASDKVRDSFMDLVDRLFEYGHGGLLDGDDKI